MRSAEYLSENDSLSEPLTSPSGTSDGILHAAVNVMDTNNIDGEDIAAVYNAMRFEAESWTLVRLMV